MTLKHVSDKDSEDLLLGSVPQKRWIEPKEVAAMVKYLISDEAKGITGEALPLTAGLYL